MRIDALLDGDLLAIPSLDKATMQGLEALLTYERKVQVETPSGMRVEPVSVSCFGYDGDPSSGIRRRLVCPYGFRRRVEAYLKGRGITLRIIDVTPKRYRQADRFEFCWELLSQVNWKWLQKEIIERLLKYRYAQIKSCTGYGKSFLAKCLCQGLTKARIVVTSHSIDVVQQLHREISSVCPDVGFVSGDGVFGENRRIVVCSGKSLHKIQKAPDLLLVDEGHEFGTDDYLAKVGLFRYARRWLLSANCGDRSDGADFELEGAFGPIIVKIPYQQAVLHKCVVPMQVRWVEVKSRFRLIPSHIQNRTLKMRIGIWCNQLRNAAIARAARSFPAEEQVLIVVDKIEHAVRLKQLLPEFTLVYGENGMTPQRKAKYVKRGMLPADEPQMTKDRRRFLAREFSKGRLLRVIATGVWNRGVDFRSLSVLIRADGLVSAIANTQIPGRVSRTHLEIGKHSGLIVDFTDEFDPMFVERARARAAQYKVHGWPQIRTTSERAGLGSRRKEKV